jgi:7-cyano-7-deazaguanine synthase in queuosine biosynthesis
MSSSSREVQSVGYQLYESELRGFAPGEVLELRVGDELDWDPVADEIEELMLFLIGSRPKVKFSKTASNPTKVKRLEFAQPVSTVSLFSGGLDSGAFAVWLGGQEPYSLLAHTETSKIMYGKARRFRSGFVGGGVRMVTFRAKSENQQWGMINTRGVVFLTNAIAVANELSARRVVVPENGPMMLNIPVSSQVQSSKTANPRMIATWTAIVNHALGANISVETPYADMTKAEIIRGLRDPDAMAHTYSCFSSQGQSRMCGLCLACFVRIASCYAASLPEDVEATYIHNPFADSLSELGDVNQGKAITITEALDFWATLAEPDAEDVPRRRERAERITKKWPVMRRHALDIMLGARGYIEAGGRCDGQVGTAALEVLGRINPRLLDKRKDELSRMQEQA